MEPGEGDPEVSRFEEVLDLLAVGIEPRRVDVDAGGQHSVDHLQNIYMKKYDSLKSSGLNEP